MATANGRLIAGFSIVFWREITRDAAEIKGEVQSKKSKTKSHFLPLFDRKKSVKKCAVNSIFSILA